MATDASTTSRRDFLALLGTTPALAIPVDRRPTSFADALAQYRAARAEADALARSMSGRQAVPDAVEDRFNDLVSLAVRRADHLFHMPAVTTAQLADKLEALAADGDWDTDAHLVIADARRLAGQA